MIKSALLYLSLLLTLSSFCQEISNVHIVTDPKNRLPGFSNFHFTVNGVAYKLKAGDCMDLQLTATSIDIIVQDRRLVKQKSEELHTSPATDVYVWVLLKFNGTFKEASYAAELICKTCYEERKEKCKR